MGKVRSAHGSANMTHSTITVEAHIRLTEQRADRLRRLAAERGTTEDQVIEKALDILFSLTDLLDDDVGRAGWSSLSESSLRRVWDNDADAAYDDWQGLYGSPAR